MRPYHRYFSGICCDKTVKTPLSHWPTQTRTTHCPTHPHAKILRGDAWGCMGMVPAQNLYFFPSPWKGLNNLSTLMSVPTENSTWVSFPTQNSRLNSALVSVPRKLQTSAPVPMQNSDLPWVSETGVCKIKGSDDAFKRAFTRQLLIITSIITWYDQPKTKSQNSIFWISALFWQIKWSNVV